MLDILITVVGIVALFFIWVMLYDSNRFVVVQHTFCTQKVKQPYRAVVLSDLHNKQFGRDNERLLEAIHKAEPDSVWIAGDMITAEAGKENTKATALLRALTEKYPVYYGSGNHEHRMKLYPEVYGDKSERYEGELAQMGVIRLVNASEQIADTGICVWGCEIDRKYYQRFHGEAMEEGYMAELLGQPDEDVYNVLIAHNPDYFPAYADWGADLVLAGHVHGGIVRIPGGRGVLSPMVRFFPKYDGGIFKEKASTMLLSRGLGTHTIPVRLFNPGELLVVNIVPQAETGDAQ